jgi:protein-disulfide isomerase
MNKKIIYLIIVLAVIVLAVILFHGQSVEYVELRDGPHLLGNPESSIVLLEYCDFNQPVCRQDYSVIKDLFGQFDDKIRFEYRHLVKNSSNTSLLAPAEAAECAADQGKFWEYAELLYAQADSGKIRLSDLASSLPELDLEIWRDCLKSDVKLERVRQDILEAEKAGYQDIPTFILNGLLIKNSADLTSQINNLLEPAKALPEAATSSPNL